jgi:hypothetical protein
VPQPTEPPCTPVLPIARQKFPSYFEGYLEFFTIFKNLYVYIPPFLVEPLTMLCRILVGRHLSKVFVVFYCWHPLHFTFILCCHVVLCRQRPCNCPVPHSSYQMCHKSSCGGVKTMS